MSGASDGEEGHSYLDVAEFLVLEGARPDEDLAELWGRIVFSRLVGNSDDHLRNHGFILERGGWRLSPMFDVNPNPDAAFAALDLTPGVQGASRDELVESAEYFHVDRNAAEKRYAELFSAISGWRALSQKLNIRRSEVDRMSQCFCIEEFR
jgi:serine/threonine-protein kinase HipA